MAVKNYRIEFPDFDYDLPEIPGMTDQCPHVEGNGWSLWFDYADPNQREILEAPRYCLHRINAEGSFIEGENAFTFGSDDLDKILVVMARHLVDTLPVDLLNMMLDMRVSDSEAQGHGKATYADVVDHANKLASDVGVHASIGENDHSATWSR